MLKMNVLQNEQSLLAKLYQEHYSWLYFWLLKKVEGSSQAEDILQDTFLKILTTGKVFSIEQPKPYLMKTATRVIIDQKRPKKIEQACVLTDAGVIRTNATDWCDYAVGFNFATQSPRGGMKL